MEQRKEHLSAPWPPNDRNVGVVLVAHSMGYVPVYLSPPSSPHPGLSSLNTNHPTTAAS